MVHKHYEKLQWGYLRKTVKCLFCVLNIVLVVIDIVAASITKVSEHQGIGLYVYSFCPSFPPLPLPQLIPLEFLIFIWFMGLFSRSANGQQILSSFWYLFFFSLYLYNTQFVIFLKPKKRKVLSSSRLKSAAAY